MLPTTHGSSKGNGIDISFLHTVNKSVALSVLWVLVSLAIIFGGFSHCRSNSYSYSFQCGADLCTYTPSIQDNERFAPLTFNRAELVGAELVRLHEGKVIMPEDMAKQKSGSFGYTVSIKYKEQAEGVSRMKTTKKQTFTPHDLGRREAKQIETKINNAMKRDKKTDNLSVSNSKSITVIGLLSIIFGIISLIFASLFGVWAESPRQLKKKS